MLESTSGRDHGSFRFAAQSPDDAARGENRAEMQRRLTVLSEKWEGRGRQGCRCGWDQPGSVVVGNIGSDRRHDTRDRG